MSKEKKYRLDIKSQKNKKLTHEIQSLLADKFDDINIIVSKDPEDIDAKALKEKGFKEIKFDIDEDNLDEQMELLVQEIEHINKKNEKERFDIIKLN